MSYIFKRLLYGTSLSLSLGKHLYNKDEYQWWHEIQPKLYLGALPLKLLNHDQILKYMGIDVVISLVEDFELSVMPQEWEQIHNIDNYIYNTPDFSPLSMDLYLKVVKTIHTCVQQGKTVYVHCKGGKGRSVLAVCAYLLTHHNNLKSSSITVDAINTPEKVYDFIKSIRPMVNLNHSQFQSLVQYWEQLQNQ